MFDLRRAKEFSCCADSIASEEYKCFRINPSKVFATRAAYQDAGGFPVEP